ncbi:MAG TPA: TonB family protein [Xanthomonadaceae bacterium]|nr:TonB family protein [Xanthomonadaceae bacterium]
MRALLLGLLLLAPTVQAEQAATSEAPRRVPFTSVVTVMGDGRTNVQVPAGVHGRLAEVVSAHLAGLPYNRAMRDGVPVSSTIMVDGDVVLIPAGDEFEIAFSDLRSQPLLLSWRPPDFPREALQAAEGGLVRATLAVDAEGNVAGVQVGSATDDAFERAVRAAVEAWRFQPPVAGEPFVVGADFWFHGNFDGPAAPADECTVAPQGAHLPGENGCLRPSETTGERHERGTARTPVVRTLRAPAPRAAGG